MASGESWKGRFQRKKAGANQAPWATLLPEGLDRHRGRGRLTFNRGQKNKGGGGGLFRKEIVDVLITQVQQPPKLGTASRE